MKGSYSVEDVQVFLTTTDRSTGEVTQHVEIIDFADNLIAESNNNLEALDFDEILRKNGIGSLYGMTRKWGETDSEFKQRILDTKKELK